MSDDSSRVGSIISKLEKLERRLLTLKNEKMELEKENAVLKQAQNEMSRRITTLEEENKRVRIAKTLASKAEDNASVRFRVNELVREIDKCIALLNK